ncbi:hypothetical protein [Pseudoroseomonas aestuarii]
MGAALLPARQEFYRLTGQLQEALNEVIGSGQRRSNEIYLESRFSVIMVMIGAVLLGIAITVLIRRSIVRPLSAFMNFVERVGRGDLGGDRPRPGMTSWAASAARSTPWWRACASSPARAGRPPRT